VSDETNPTDPTMTTATAPLPTAAAEVERPADPRPRIRFAAIAWGVVFASAALILLGTVVDPARRAMAADWLLSLEGGAVGVILVLTVGGLLVLGGVLGAVRRWQRRADAES
jgi:hypothetical protein